MEPSLRAIRRYQTFIEEIPRFWKPDKSEWKEMRIWSIDNDGRLTVVPAEPLTAPIGFPNPDTFAKDTYLVAASAWIRRNHPAAVVFSVEMWGYRMDEHQRERMYARYGRTPNLCEAEHREALTTIYKAELWQSLIVHGEIHGQPPTTHLYTIGGAALTPRTSGGDIRGIWNGILTGEVDLSRPKPE